MKKISSKDEITVGFHSCKNIFISRPNDIKEVFIKKSKSDKYRKILDIANKNNIKTNYVNDDSFFLLSKVETHQGIMIIAKKKKYLSEEDLKIQLKHSKNKEVFLVIDKVDDPRNLGACIRTAEGFSINGIIVDKNNAPQINETVKKVSAGATEYMNIYIVSNLSRVLDTFKKNNVWVYGTSGNCKNYIDNYIFNYPLAIVIGGENKGLSKNIQKKCDDLISIKMTGNTESFNMSVAASIFLYVTSAKKSD